MVSSINERISDSWDNNAARWTEAVRGGSIRSRTAGTDAAIVAAVARLNPASVLDLGCGEGWLARRLAGELGCRVVGVDGSAELIRLAHEADPTGCYIQAGYDAIAAEPGELGGPFDIVVANFALLSEDLSAPLRASRASATLIIQTVHPWSACSDLPYADGWREERFAAFGTGTWTPMPWYFRTLESWISELACSGWQVDQLKEPADPETGRPLSLLLICRPHRTAAASLMPRP